MTARPTPKKTAGPKPRTVARAAKKPPRRQPCHLGHPGYADACSICDEISTASFQETIRNPPAVMVIRCRDGSPPTYYRVPKHARRVRR